MKDLKTKFILTVCLSVLSALVLAAACYFLFLLTDQKMIQVSETQNTIFEYEKRIENAKTLKKSLTTFELERTEVEAAVSGSSVVNFIEELEYLAQKTGLELKIRTADQTDSGQNPVFMFRVSGRFDSIYWFLYLLEHDRYQAEISKFMVQKPEGKAFWEADMEVELLNFKINED